MPSARISSKDMLSRLVGFDTTSSKSNLALMDFVRDYLDGFGISSQLIFDERKEKANLLATIGPAQEAGVILSGHSDVVPVEGQDWHSDPFALKQHDGRLYGRGTCDMKGFIACALSKVPDFVSAPLQRPVHLAFSYDEEVGCLGARDLVEKARQLETLPRFCVVGEPTDMKPISAHKGVCDFECVVHGLECHSSLAPYGVNAVEAAAELVSYVKGIARRLARQGPFNRSFDPPFTTVHTGVIRGGTALNIVPNRCEFTLEVRSIPEQDVEALLAEIRNYAWKNLEPEMKAIDPKTGFEFLQTANVPAFSVEESHEIVEWIKSLTGANSTEKVSFGTEAGIFQQGGIPTIVCGPGSIAQAHKPDEFVREEQILRCDNFLSRLTQSLCRA